MATTVETSSLGHRLTNTIGIKMKVARRLGQPLLLRNMFEAALQAGDLPALFPIALGSAALHAKGSTGVNGLKHMTFCITPRRRGNVPCRRRPLAENAKTRQRSQGLGMPTPNVFLPDINQAAVNLSNEGSRRLKANRTTTA